MKGLQRFSQLSPPAGKCLRRSTLERLEERHMFAADLAAIDGLGNNLLHPEWGSADQNFIRLGQADYADGASTPNGGQRPNPRQISNAVHAQQAQEAFSQRELSAFVFQWGQFLDHDLDLAAAASPPEWFNIPIPAGDAEFDPKGNGDKQFPMQRSAYDADSGTGVDNPRQQVNSITAFLDGSNVYGSDDLRAAALRSGQGGRLKTSQGDLLPYNTAGMPNEAPGQAEDYFLAGDVRVNEQAGLTAMHTLWMREHNRLAEQLAAKHPRWGDERLYQEARRWVVAEMQAITYNEFLPAVLGPNAPQAYHGYDPHVRPDISNEFAAAAFRVGHTMLPTHLLRVDASGNEIPAGHLALRDGFFQPQAVREAGVEVLLRGLARQQQQEIDAQIVDDVRNFMFGQPNAGGLDLASLNIQRGREHGLPSYNQLRATVGLDPVTRFSEITGDPLVAQQLAATYDTVDDVDAWVGGICEDHLTGSSLGETFTRIWVEQFTRTRAADRFWFENVFHGKELRQLQNLRLADVLAANGVSGPLQANVFFTPSTLTVRAAAKTALDITVRVRTDGAEQVEIYDNVRRQVIAQQALSATKRVFIQGGSRNDRITIAPAFPLPIEVLGGEGMDSLDYRGTEHNDAVDIYFRQLQSDTAASLNYGQVEQLNVFGGAGDDRLQVHGRSEARLALLGNAGNDTLLGGEDADILSGGAGNDLLWGGGGKDWLLAGRGRDRLLTGHGRNRDLTVYWATPLDDNAHALQTLFSMWSVVYRLR